ncbi:MAG: hypothetical protein B7Z47_02015 [Chthoniobacter sp. 12-60-6]|nr:MAG: hypothetical protein B7Z47_02015 [Chthoniobacter sp. 12-60-6]
MAEVRVHKVNTAGSASEVADVTAREEPLEIRVEGRSVAVVMRTPGHDEELASGFLVSEGVVQKPRDILEVSQCPSTNNEHGNIVDVLLGGAVVNWESLTRHVFSASSCGLCGKTSIESVFQQFPAVKGEWQVSPKQRDLLPLDRHILLVSGRVSFEIIQKALAGGIPLVAAISAPSSLAVDFAQEAGQTLVGFLRGETMNVYTHPQRLKTAP